MPGIAPAPPRFGFVSIREYGGQFDRRFRTHVQHLTDRHDYGFDGQRLCRCGFASAGL
jgi:hypothetical protein